MATSFTPRRFAYSLDNVQAGPAQASPEPVVSSISQGGLESTPTRNCPAFLMASIRGLVPAAGTSCACATPTVSPRPRTADATRRVVRENGINPTPYLF